MYCQLHCWVPRTQLRALYSLFHMWRLDSPQRCVALLYPFKGPWCSLLVFPAIEPVLLATVLVLMVILEEAQETIAHCSACVIVHGIPSFCRIMDRASSTSWHLVDAPQTFPEPSQVLLCLEGPGPCCTVLDEEFVSRNVEVEMLQDRVIRLLTVLS